MDGQYQLNSGARIYNKFFLLVYDIYVLNFAGGLIWKCPKNYILSLYNQFVSAKHLEIGVGTGYFLQKCQFPTTKPDITLVDLNPNCLNSASQRIKKYEPRVYQTDICSELKLPEGTRFDSVGMNYLLHCLPGDMEQKSQPFINIKPYLNPGAVIFGATVLGDNAASTPFVKRYLKFCNKQGVFTNLSDTAQNLETMLKKHFNEVSVQQVGCAGIFVIKN